MKPLSDEEIVAALREVEVPEPSPLFWEHLSQRVHDAVAAEPVPSASWASRFRFAWAGGIVAVVSAVLLAVTVSVRHQSPAVQGASAIADVADIGSATVAAASLDDASWAVMGELASEMDFDEAGAAGLTLAPGAAENALGDLSGDEQRAVVELLRQEIKNSKHL